MSDASDIQAELEVLRKELAELRAWRDSHVCAGSAQMAGLNTIGGAAGPTVMHVVPYPPMATSTVTSWGYTVGCAAGVNPMITYEVGGECA